MTLINNFIIADNERDHYYWHTDFKPFVRYSSTILDETHTITDKDTVAQLSSSFFNSLVSYKTQSFDSGLIPPGLKMLGSNYLVFERPPTVKNIFYVPAHKSSVPDNTDNLQQVYALPIPWQLYFVYFNPDMYTYSVHMFFMNTSINSPDQNLYLPPLPNFYTHSLLCPPVMSTMEDVDRYSKNVSGIMHCAYDWVWNSGTNHDLTEACMHVSFQCPRENSVMKYLDDNVYNVYFNKNRSLTSSRYQASTSYISHLFSSWEKCTLSEVCNFVWPNTSAPFRNFNYESNDITGTSAYQDNLVSYLDNGDYDMDDIQDIIENDSYDHNDYINYLYAEKLISEDEMFNNLNRAWSHVYTYEEVIPKLIADVSTTFSRTTNSFSRTLVSIDQARRNISA